MWKTVQQLMIVITVVILLYVGSYIAFIHRPLRTYKKAGNDLDDYSHNWFPAAAYYDGEYTGLIYQPKYMYVFYWPLHRVDWFISGNNAQDLGNGYVLIYKTPGCDTYIGPGP